MYLVAFELLLKNIQMLFSGICISPKQFAHKMQNYNTIVHFLFLLMDIWLLIIYTNLMILLNLMLLRQKNVYESWNLWYNGGFWLTSRFSLRYSQSNRKMDKKSSECQHQSSCSHLRKEYFLKNQTKILHKHDNIHLCFEGHETKAMLNNRGPRYKRSRIEQRMNMDIFLCVGLLFVMCLVGAVGMKHWQKSFS